MQILVLLASHDRIGDTGRKPDSGSKSLPRLIARLGT